MFTLYSADFINAPSNCSYPHKTEVMGATDLVAAVSRDYVCAEYMNHYRNGENFLGSDCLPVDCDNDHSENPADWVTPADVQAAFPGITFAVHYSRFHMREKNGKPARPKFHVLFPIECMTDPAAYSEMKKLVNTIFPYFDTKALDAARFFFGTADPQVEIFPGEMTLSEYLSADDFDADMPGGSHGGTQVIAEGSRNATMSRFAGRVIKKYGDNDTAFQCFMEEAEKCTPPLEQQELMTIWHSAQKFYAKVQQQDGYVPPELYNDDTSYKPDDFSDVGQAEVLAKHFSGELRYSPVTHYIRYNGRYWQETEPGAQAVAHELTRRQLKEASSDMMAALTTLKACGAQEILDNNSKAKAECLMSDEQMEAYQVFLSAKAYDEYAKRHGMLMKTLLVVNALYYAKDGLTQREICQRTLLSKQTVNLIIKNLLADSYVTISEIAEDKRNKRVTMTDAGRTYCKDVVTHITWAEDTAMSMLTPEEQAQLIDLSRRFTQNLIKLVNSEEEAL